MKAFGKGESMANVYEAASSFLMYRALINKSMAFSEDLPPRLFEAPTSRIHVQTTEDVEKAIVTVLEENKGRQIALALSGGIDSAIIAKYLPKGTLAYTFRCVAEGAIDETVKAREYADICGLNHKIIDVTWEDYMQFAPVLMRHKGAPIHSIEPQIYKAAMTAKADGVTHLIFGESADAIFGGMDGLISEEWTFDAFVDRYTYIKPEKIIKHGKSILEPFQKYQNGSGIDYYHFVADYFYHESNGSYDNACSAVGVGYVSPFNRMILDAPLDYKRIRSGEPKYMLAELFCRLYGVSAVPRKLPMPRAVKQWLKDWKGPIRSEFIPNCIDGLSADQKWMVFILEMFLNIMNEPEQ